jgi:hypothetical protein
METKTLVIFLAGGVAGYLLSQYMSGKIEGVPVKPPTESNEPCPEGTQEVIVNCITAPCPKICEPITITPQ